MDGYGIINVMTRKKFICVGAAFAAAPAFAKEPEHLKGYLMASWMDCKNDYTFRLNCEGMDQLAVAMENSLCEKTS
jgi:hypothetical protein